MSARADAAPADAAERATPVAVHASPRPRASRGVRHLPGSSRRLDLRQRAVVRGLLIGTAALRLLPDGPVYRAAHATGVLLSLVMPRRRALVRENLLRVCLWLDAQDRATPRVRAAARDPRRLDALVRDAFGHWARTYAESAMAPRYDAATLRDRIRLDAPETTRAALHPEPDDHRGRIYVGFHFGAVELGALYAARLGRVPVAGPMETVASPALRAYFEHTRGALGVGIVSLDDVARGMSERLERGLGVALVADRVVRGTGVSVQLFGAPARLPLGPAVLAAESGAGTFVISIRRVGWNRWAGRVEAIELQDAAPRRARVRDALEQEVHLLERCVADAPEQWWSLFFPIWEAPRAGSQ